MQALLSLIVLLTVATGQVLAAEEITESFTTQEGYEMEVVFRDGKGFILRMDYTQFLAKYPDKPNPRQRTLLARNHARLLLEQEVKRIAADQIGTQEGWIQGILAQPNGGDMEVQLKKVRVNDDSLDMEVVRKHIRT